MASSGQVIAEQLNGPNGYYDLRLRHTGDKEMLIEVAMSIFFRFIPNGADSSIIWTDGERRHFVSEWLRQIPGTWDQADHATYKGFDISLVFICDVRAQPASTQWQGNVMKLKSRNAFRTSSVWRNGYPEDYDAKFDSNDDLEKPGGRRQTAMIHEFGHMLRLPDEYENDSPHAGDKNSVMNVGAEVRDRHLARFVQWAKPHIDKVADGLGIQAKELSPMSSLRHIAQASSKQEEIAAVQAWRDGGGPDEGVHFVVRRRDSQEEVALGEISFESFEAFEVEFSSAEEKNGELVLWQPKSSEAFEMFFVE